MFALFLCSFTNNCHWLWDEALWYPVLSDRREQLNVIQLLFHPCTTNPNTPDQGSTLSNITCFCEAVCQCTEEIIDFFPTPKYHGEKMGGIVADVGNFILSSYPPSPPKYMLCATKVILSEASWFSKACRGHVAAQADEGKKLVFPGGWTMWENMYLM